MNASRFCRDCRLAQTAYSLWTCRRLTGPSLVTGEYERCLRSCDVERADVELCGPGGRYWEPKRGGPPGGET